MIMSFKDAYLESLKKKENNSKSIEDKIKELKVPLPDKFGKISHSFIRQGPGSGLNADLLDGYDSNQFFRIGTTLSSLTVTSASITTGLFGDGSVSAPSISFIDDTNLGWYRIGSDNIGLALNGTKYWDASTTAIKNFVSLQSNDGSASTPAFGFNSDTNTGIYRGGTDTLDFATGGTLRLEIDTSVVASTLPMRGPDGSASAPTFSFTGSTGSGMFRSGSSINFAVAGTSYTTLTSSALSPDVPVRVPDGSAGAPSYSFSGNTDTGMLRSGASIYFSVDSTLTLGMTPTAVLPELPVRGTDGSQSAPSYSFVGDTNTGLWRIGADNIGVSIGDSKATEWHDNGVVSFPGQSACRAYRSGNQDIASGLTLTKVAFNAESYDVRSEFDSTTNNRFTASKAGKYLVNSVVQYVATTSVGDYGIAIYVNGSLFSSAKRRAPANTDGYSIQHTDIVNLSANDYVEIFVYVNTAGEDVLGGSDSSFVDIHKLS